VVLLAAGSIRAVALGIVVTAIARRGSGSPASSSPAHATSRSLQPQSARVGATNFPIAFA
jgi:hypothetical protein